MERIYSTTLKCKLIAMRDTNRSDQLAVTVCICTFRRTSILDAIESVARQNLPEGLSVRILVIDNDDEPTAKEAIAKFCANIWNYRSIIVMFRAAISQSHETPVWKLQPPLGSRSLMTMNALHPIGLPKYWQHGRARMPFSDHPRRSMAQRLPLGLRQATITPIGSPTRKTQLCRATPPTLWLT